MTSRPAAIHDNISFNTKVGLDLASWKNAKGKEFSFVHFIDEGTMFHLGAECLQGTEGVMEHFENLWVNWAGYPQEVYVDPGGGVRIRIMGHSHARSRHQSAHVSQ